MPEDTQFFTHKNDIKAWLEKYAIEDYSITPVEAQEKERYHGAQWLVNAKSVFLFNEYIPALPVCFGKVVEDFICQFCSLETLKGTPRVILGNFLVRENNLTSLDFGPERVLKDYLADNNDITRIGGKYANCQYVGGDFSLEQNPLESVEYVPMEASQYFKANLEPTQKKNDLINGIVRAKPKPLIGFEAFYSDKGKLRLIGEQYKSICEKLSFSRALDNANSPSKKIQKI